MTSYHNLDPKSQYKCKGLADNEVYTYVPESLLALDIASYFDNLSQPLRNDNEILNHWFVSAWLAEKLIECDEIVCDDFHGKFVWSNTCGGALYEHPSIVAIATDSIEDYVESFEDEEEEEYVPIWDHEVEKREHELEVQKAKEESRARLEKEIEIINQRLENFEGEDDV